MTAMFQRKITASRAIAMVHSSIHPLNSELIKFSDASGRVLAADIHACCDHPPFDRAAMDGYAVIASSTFYATPENPIRLREGSEAVRIMTGKPVPEGFDAVVMMEYTREAGEGIIEISRAVVPGKNVASRGEDIRAGSLILGKGRRLLPHDLGTLAAAGVTSVPVLRSPVVAIISTGDEIVDPEELDDAGRRAGKVADINSFTLASLVADAGGKPVRCGIVKDEFETLKRAIRSVSGFDLILVSGGSSVGDKDYLAAIIDQLGELLFHGVSVKPGGPVGFGFLDQTPVFILPGYPVAAIVAFELFVRPALNIMQGLDAGMMPYKVIRAELLRKIPSQVGRLDFVRVKIQNKEGKIALEPLGTGGSGSIGRMSVADGFILVDEPLEGIDAGSMVEAYCYPVVEV
ncbi:MAG: molybdopterin biosynthesis protein MoeA [Candidatus Syntrophoarchaeum caldarius]|uniref:Molybdopterin biosynthesis protein MoeA n=1 Tax=Candidatus Syntropharchaeum caldarium TaxID=1838285 RepID=A0A1F2P9I0_9EURY|nr:MAG: molybdopterin biosynthesis protein MoeA [Candidatus Syntrophoarchaeum caldarius]